MAAEASENFSVLARRARVAYSEGNHDAALATMRQIISHSANAHDPKVLCNMAVLDYVASDAWEPHRLLDALENGMAAMAEKRKPEVGKGGKVPMLADDSDAWLLMYNEAVAHFQLRRFATAARLLEQLFMDIKPLDDTLAVRVAFLLLEVYIHAYRTSAFDVAALSRLTAKFGSVIAFLEQPHLFNGLRRAASASMAPPGEASPGASTTSAHSAPSGAAAGGAAAGAAGSGADGGEAEPAAECEFRFRLHLFKAKLQLLHRNIKTSKKELKSALEIYQRAFRQPGAAAADLSEDGAAFDAAAAAASETLASSLVTCGWWLPPHGSRNATALALKANLEYLRGNYRKSIKLMDACLRGGVPKTLFLNNLGCIHFSMRRYASASLLFARALQAQAAATDAHSAATVVHADGSTTAACGDARARHARQPYTHGEAEVLYNEGLSLLHINRPQLALRCFQAAASALRHSPMVWLRMAECCVMAHARQIEADLSAPGGEGGDLVECVVGRGPHRRLLLPSHRPSAHGSGIPVADSPRPLPTGDERAARREGDRSRAAARALGMTEVCGSLSLEYAAKCLRNTLYLLAPHTRQRLAAGLSVTPDDPFGLAASAGAAVAASSAGGAGGGTSSGSAPGTSPATAVAAAAAATNIASAGTTGKPGGEDTPLSFELPAKQTALLLLAYVSLCMDNPAGALAAAVDLLAMPELPGDAQRRLLAHTYCAEALCHLDRPAEAGRHLLPLLTSMQQQASAGASEARAALYLNLATVHVLQGETSRAEVCASQALANSPALPQALRLLVYLRLRRHDVKGALAILKRRRASTRPDYAQPATPSTGAAPAGGAAAPSARAT